MGAATSFTAVSQLGPRVGGRQGRSASVVFTLSLAIAVGAAYLGSITAFTATSRTDEAAKRTSELVAKYVRLVDGDFNATLFPIARGVADSMATPGLSPACEIVISGIDASGPTPIVKWQRAQGDCAISRIGRPGTQAAIANAPIAADAHNTARALVAVEVFTGSARTGTDGYAIALTTPANGTLPIMAATRTR